MSNKVDARCKAAKIRFVDENGNSLSSKQVHMELVKHEFLFGCGGFDALPLTNDMSPDMLAFYSYNTETAKTFYQDRMDKWMQIFNYATLPFYWGGYEPTEGDVQFESRMNATNYMVDHGVTVKGHPLCWHTVCADWLLQYDNKTILDKQLQRIDRDVTAFRGKIDKWDVINETVIMPVFDKYDNAITRICNAYGRINLIKEVFQAAQAANPGAQLLINDFNLSDEYRRVISDCLDAGVPIHAIGIQTHQHQGYKGMDWLNDVLERFSVFGLPLHFTENTLVSGEIMPAHIVDLNDFVVDEWPSTPEGEERQAREWKEMYERLFSEPLVEAITGWDFADGAWLNAPSGIIRKDNSTKPSFHTLKNLVHETWNTVVDTLTNENGIVDLDGYKGIYVAHMDGKEVQFTLSKDTDEITVVVK